jgi:hypothetical protein
LVIGKAHSANLLATLVRDKDPGSDGLFPVADRFGQYFLNGRNSVFVSRLRTGSLNPFRIFDQVVVALDVEKITHQIRILLKRCSSSSQGWMKVR